MKGDSEAEVDAVEYECSQAITLREASANFCDHNHTKEDFEIAEKDIGAGWRAKYQPGKLNQSATDFIVAPAHR